jgi:hypothetical protein
MRDETRFIQGCSWIINELNRAFQVKSRCMPPSFLNASINGHTSLGPFWPLFLSGCHLSTVINNAWRVQNSGVEHVLLVLKRQLAEGNYRWKCGRLWPQ